MRRTSLALLQKRQATVEDKVDIISDDVVLIKTAIFTKRFLLVLLGVNIVAAIAGIGVAAYQFMNLKLLTAGYVVLRRSPAVVGALTDMTLRPAHGASNGGGAEFPVFIPAAILAALLALTGTILVLIDSKPRR